MFQLIKKFFQKEDVVVEIPVQTIKLNELPAWLESHKSQNVKSIHETVNPMMEKIDDILFATEENLKRLEHAELRNKKISGRELELMKGNKAAYLLRTRQFLQFFVLEEKEKTEYKALRKIVERYEKEIPVYHDGTLRQYAILQQFFGNETYAIAQNIKELGQQMKELKILLQKQSTEALEEIEQEIKDLLNRQEQKKRLEKESNAAEEEEKRFETLTKELEEKKKNIEDSAAYKEYLALAEEKQTKIKDAEKSKQKIIQHFTGIEKALRKYAKKFPEAEKTILSYLDGPLDTLQNDTRLEIVALLQNVAKELEQDALEIKEDKKEKLLEELRKTTKEYLNQMLHEYKRSTEEKEMLEKRVTQHPAYAQYMDIVYMLKTYDEKRNAFQKEKEHAKESAQGLAVAEHAKRVAEEIERCVKLPVEIIVLD